jgi:hypothetical protein
MARRQVIDKETHHELVELTRELGEQEARRALGDLSPEAFARAHARLPQQVGTLLTIRTAIQARKSGRAA